MTMQLVIFGGTLLLQAILAWRLIVTHRAIARVNARLVNQGEALSLLTDTSENGFGAIARELQRLAVTDAKPARRPTTKRVASAARRGRSVTEIAATERVSEGEVRLRLHLAGQLSDNALAERA
jgi:DNA-directed RNA polymerase specialized sigma24 family protein